MKTIKTQSSHSPKLITKILINRSQSGKMIRKNSMSIGSQSGFFESESLLKNSGQMQNQTRHIIKPEYPDYYQFYNVKRPRIKNVNGFMKIKSQEKPCSHDLKTKTLLHHYSKTKQGCQKTHTVKFRQSNHKISQISAEQENHTNTNSINYLFKSKEQKLKILRRDLESQLISRFREMKRAEEKIIELQRSSQLLEIIQLKMISKLEELRNEKCEQKVYFGDTSADSIHCIPQKSVLEDTSDSGSCKQIAEEYGLGNSYKL